MTYYSTTPPLFPTPKPHIAHYFTSPCYGCFFPSHSSQPAAIIGKMCFESKLWLLPVHCIIAHRWRVLLSWRGHYRALQGSRTGITCTLVMIYQSCQWPYFFTSSWAEWVVVLHEARCIDPWICYHVTRPVLLLPALLRMNSNSSIKISLYCLDKEPCFRITYRISCPHKRFRMLCWQKFLSIIFVI